MRLTVEIGDCVPFGGGYVTGTVSVHAPSGGKVKALLLEFVGRAFVGGVGARARLFVQTAQLLPEQTLSRGCTRCAFELRVPALAPPTFAHRQRGAFGVAYELRAKLKRGFGHASAKAVHSVLLRGARDRTLLQRFLPPHSAAVHKSFMFEHARVLRCTIGVPSRAMCAGAVLPLQLKLENGTSRRVTHVTVQLTESIQFRGAVQRYDKFQRDLAESGVAPASTLERSFSVQCPSHFNISFSAGALFDVSHALVVKCRVPMARDLIASMPVLFVHTPAEAAQLSNGAATQTRHMPNLSHMLDPSVGALDPGRAGSHAAAAAFSVPGPASSSGAVAYTPSVSAPPVVAVSPPASPYPHIAVSPALWPGPVSGPVPVHMMGPVRAMPRSPVLHQRAAAHPYGARIMQLGVRPMAHSNPPSVAHQPAPPPSYEDVTGGPPPASPSPHHHHHQQQLEATVQPLLLSDSDDDEYTDHTLPPPMNPELFIPPSASAPPL